MASVKDITDVSFNEEVVQSDLPVLVDFWASWCGPCKMMAPVLDEAAKDMDGKIKFTKLNVDENPATAGKYGIMSIPTMVLFKDGEPLGKLVGFMPKASLKKALEGALA